MTVPAALHPFVILAKSATGAACADLIKQATSANGAYTFTALLEAENVQKLAGTEHEPSLNLLRIFSWGTYRDYTNNAASLPPLNEAQLDKLRRLTLVTLASESHDLPYSTLMEAVDITTTRALEDLCINTIYASLLTGKLSPKTQTFQIASCTSRDLSPTTVDYAGMIATLTQWSRQCDLVLAEITGRIRDVKVAAANRKLAEEEYEREVENAKRGDVGKKPVKAKASGKDKVNVGEEAEESMQLDMEEEEVRTNMTTGGESPTGRKRKLGRLHRK